MRPCWFSGKLSSALPMYTLPFTTVGDELTMGSPVAPLQISSQTNWPHGPALHARTCAVFLPANTTPPAIVGEDSTAAWNPVPKSIHRGPHDACPQPVALNTPVMGVGFGLEIVNVRSVASLTNTVLGKNAFVMDGGEAAATGRGLSARTNDATKPGKITSKASERAKRLSSPICR